MSFESCIDYVALIENEINLFYVEGWCFNQSFGDCEYRLFLNGKEVDIKPVYIPRPELVKNFSNGITGNGRGFYIRYESKEPIKSIQLNAYRENESITLIHYNEKRCNQIRNTTNVDFYVDSYVIDKEKTEINGWATGLDKSYIEVSIVDEHGNEIPSKIDHIARRDLIVFKVIDESQALCGFHIEFNSTKNISFKFKNQEGDTIVPVQKQWITEDKTALVSKLNQRNINKAKDYIKSKGLKKLLNRLTTKNTQSNSTYNEVALSKEATKEELEIQKNTQFILNPKMSLVVATFNTPVPYLKRMIDTVKEQSYSNWELCIADGSSDSSVIDYIETNYKDKRIKYVKLDKNYGIAGNMNEAIKIATGDFIGLYDHDDELCLNALFEFVKAYNKNPNLEVIYSDEDKINSEGTLRFEPLFKPDFNIDFLRTVNYICHLLFVKKDRINKIGLLRSEYDGAQDHDFILRCTENLEVEKIYHIPMVLYHWRIHQNSTAGNAASKMYAFDAGVKAVQDHYARIGIHAQVSHGPVLGNYRTKYILDDKPLVSIIIPTMDHIDILKRCIDSIESKSSYPNYEILLIENNSVKEETFSYYKELENDSKVRVIYYQGIFNYSAINNYGVRYAKGDYYLFLNNDTEVIEKEWIEELLGYAERTDVGAVGARLYYPDDSIQHVGVIIGIYGIASHMFIGYPKGSAGYAGRIFSTQDLSAVTAACMMTKKSVFEEVEGFNEQLPVAFNDIDFCLKIRQLGYLIVMNPYCELYHYESKTRGLENNVEKYNRFLKEKQIFLEKWKSVIDQGDPYFNPNFSLEKTDFSLKG